MTPITYPNILEKFQRALHEVFNFYFDGLEHTIGLRDIQFAECDLVYDIRRLEHQVTKPTIAILGTRKPGDQKTLHCKDPDGVRQFGFETRIQVERTVIVKVPRASNDPDVGNKREADRVWDQLVAIVLTQHKQFNDRNIFIPTIDPVPAELPDDKYAMVAGCFECEIRAAYSKD